jgi:hypothetical protein
MKSKILLIIISFVAGIFIGFYKQEKTISILQNKYDSIKSETFIKDLKIMRYEYIISEDTSYNKALKETE